MSAVIGLLNQPAVLRLGAVLLHFLWQGAAVAVVAMVMLAVMRRRSAQARYVIALAFFGAMALCPIVTVLAWHGDAASPDGTKPGPVVPAALPFTAQEPSIPLNPRSSATASPPSVPAWQMRPSEGTVLAEPATNRDRLRFSIVGAREWLNDRLAWFVAFWLTGVTLLSLRLLVGWAGIARMRRRGVQAVDEAWINVLHRLAARLGIRRPVLVLQSALAEVPTVLGWLKPVVLLPASALTGLSPAQLEAILAHELAHVRRHDYLVNVLQTVVETLLFYQPAVWWLSRRIRREREHCCDDLAVALCGDRLLYARALATLEASRTPPSPPYQGGDGGIALAATGGPLLSRIRRLVGASPAPSHVRPWWPTAALTIGVILALTVALQFGAASVGATRPVAQQKIAAEGKESPTASSTNVLANTAITPAPHEQRREAFALTQSRAWYILSQTDTNGLLHGLPQRLAKAIVPSRRKDKAWTGVVNGGRLELEIGVDGDVEGEIFVGFFADPRWYLAEPVQVRSFPGPGKYTVEKLIPGRYVLGAMIGELPRPDALGVHARWPAAVEINDGQTAKARLLLSTKFQNMPAGVVQQLEGFAGQWEKMDPAHMITVRTVDEQGRPFPFCRVTLVDRDETTTREFHESGTDDRAFAYCDKIDSTFSVCSARYDFLPELMASRGYYRKIEQLHDATNRPVVTVAWDDFPTGTGKVVGRVHNQHGQPLDEYYITLTRWVGERRDWSDAYSYWIHVPVINAEGRYEVAGLPPGTYSVMVRHFDYPTHVYHIGPEEQPSFTIPDEENALVEFDVEVEAKTLLYGRAVYEDGTPVHPAICTAWFERYTKEQIRENHGESGRNFALPLNPDGSFRVCLSAKECEDLLKNSEGTIEITAYSETIVDGQPRYAQQKLGQVHIDKLSQDKEHPAKVVFPRPVRPQ